MSDSGVPGSACGRAIAHRRPEDGATHDLREHLTATAELAAEFASAWGASEVARLCGLWHDLGKHAPEFQQMIREADTEAHMEGVKGAPKRRVNHSSAGALWAMRRMTEFRQPPLGQALAYVIAGHHAGLPDWQSDGGGGLRQRLEETAHLERALNARPPRDLMEQGAPTEHFPQGADLGLWIRMLASAVCDADFLDTESFFDPDRQEERDHWPDLGTLRGSLDARLEKFRGATGAVNEVRAHVLQACREAAELGPGLFALTVPTGGGKTLSSLAFALGHAIRHKMRRVIYAIPFTSIIEQTASVFRDALGDDAVLEHHSALIADERTARARLAAENWDAPLIVTTTVQLFESLFAARTSHIRKLHNIAGSVLILDEAQALPPPVLLPVTIVLDQLVRHYGVSVVLCTATQPALGAVFKRMPDPIRIVREPERLFAALDRVDIDAPREPMSWEEMAERIASEPQALVIVNTRRQARALRDLLPKGTIHLSTWQCAAHRKRLLAEVRERLKDKAAVRVVSTSLVEAGVDIDFPVVLRAWCGLDSLAQAAGRCNREGRLPGRGRFVAFRPADSSPTGHLLQAIQATETTLHDRRGAESFAPGAFEDFFNALYWLKGEDALDAYEMRLLLNLGRTPTRLDLSFRTAAETFRMIDDAQRPVVIPYDDKARCLIDTLRYAGPSRGLMRDLQPYTVPLARGDFERLMASHVTEDLDGVTVLVTKELYRDDVGLDVPALGDPTAITLIC